jgi:DNA adenine methylase
MPKKQNLSPLTSYPGSKAKVSDLVWSRFGRVNRYVEPFLGSGAIWLGRPGEGLNGYGEIVNDRSGMIVNMWRALAGDPDTVADLVDWVGSTTELESRQKALLRELPALTLRLEADPRFYDVELAGWTIYGMSWVTHARAFMNDANCRVGRPSAVPAGAHAVTRPPIREWFEVIRQRIRKSVILCDDWEKCVTSAILHGNKTDYCAVFLDPPYGDDRKSDLYQVDSQTVYQDVLAWALEKTNDRTRICVAGYEGEHDILEQHGWSVVAWSSAHGGESRHKERLWFSPSCIQEDLLSPMTSTT